MSVAWPWLLGIALISRMNGSALFLLSLACLAALSVLDVLDMTTQIFGARGSAIVTVIGLFGVVTGAISSIAATLLGDNLYAAATSSIFTGLIKMAGAVLIAPFRLILGNRSGGGR
jgi:uncharacterized metal-binding protein